MIDPLRALALLYEENGDHAEASATLEDARYVTRVHQGLASADEALLLRQQIRSEKARGNHERVWDLEQDMVTIARQHHDDIRMVPIFRELGDDRLEVIEQVLAGERPPIIALGCYYGAERQRYDDTRGERQAPLPRGGDMPGAGPRCGSGTRGAIVTRLQHEILMYYADAIETILRTGDYASPELRELEKAALRVASGRGGGLQVGAPGGSFAPCSYAILDDYLMLEVLDSCLAPVGHGDGWVYANVGNQASLIRLISYEIRSAASAEARANAVAEFADSFLVGALNDQRSFSSLDETALELYERAYRELQQDGNVQASTARIFAPELPVTVPTLAPNPFASAVARESPRYIDVAFAVTKYGRGERIEILATSKDATRDEKRDLIRLIESTGFRPRVVDGELAALAPVVLRCHLAP